MVEATPGPPSPERDRRRQGWVGDEDVAPPLAIDLDGPVESLRAALSFVGAARMFVAAFDLDLPWLVERAVASLPPGLQGVRRAPTPGEASCNRLARLYGMITALAGGGRNGDGIDPVRLRLVPPFRLPDRLLFVLENASRRADDEPVKAYWVPLPAIERGSITVVDSDTVKIDRVSVIFRIERGVLGVSPGREYTQEREYSPGLDPPRPEAPEP